MRVRLEAQNRRLKTCSRRCLFRMRLIRILDLAKEKITMEFQVRVKATRFFDSTRKKKQSLCELN